MAKTEYKLVKTTCVIGGCPSILTDNKGNFCVIGKTLDQKKLGKLSNKVGVGESVVIIPKKLLKGL